MPLSKLFKFEVTIKIADLKKIKAGAEFDIIKIYEKGKEYSPYNKPLKLDYGGNLMTIKLEITKIKYK